ncbi:hypothetical protein [Rossellomorea aquimaris]|uniref:Uncharacterized protein n=2 Tax=Rossellomorea TaxID=2837508 RepID=A0A5D4U7A5_9BACI|nr:hypothetical protein [Rossellomorea aquimaris]TYS83226.1 hypothetical protein FZC80_02540 [Rossellomorea aquimaris]
MKLILVEGIPGSGKTTACGYIKKQLEDQGNRTKVYLEGDLDHPADYEATAFVSADQLGVLSIKFPELKEKKSFQQYKGTQAGVLIPYNKLSQAGELTSECTAELSKYDVYEMPPELYKELILNRWSTFVEKVKAEDFIVVADCCFMQNPLTMLMAKYNESCHSIKKFVSEIEEVIRELNPLVIYLEPVSIKEVIENVKMQRSPEWFKHVSSYYTKQEYGKAHSLPEGLEGVVQLLEDRAGLEKQLLSLLKIKHAVIPVSVQDRRTEEMLAESLIAACGPLEG